MWGRRTSWRSLGTGPSESAVYPRSLASHRDGQPQDKDEIMKLARRVKGGYQLSDPTSGEAFPLASGFSPPTALLLCPIGGPREEATITPMPESNARFLSGVTPGAAFGPVHVIWEWEPGGLAWQGGEWMDVCAYWQTPWSIAHATVVLNWPSAPTLDPGDGSHGIGA